MLRGFVPSSRQVSGCVFDGPPVGFPGGILAGAVSSFTYAGFVSDDVPVVLITTNPDDGVVTPTILNLTTSATPGVETSLAFPLQLKRFQILNAGTDIVTFSFTPGQPAVPYVTIFPRADYEETGLLNPVITGYFRSNSASQRLEIVYWV